MAKITYNDKEAIKVDPAIEDKNKIKAADINEIKKVININADELASVAGDVAELKGKTVPEATSTILGTVRLGSDTIQTATRATIGTTASRTYALQKDSNNQLVVNVPWTNTTYSTITQAVITTGTATTGYLMTSALLRANCVQTQNAAQIDILCQATEPAVVAGKTIIWIDTSS